MQNRLYDFYRLIALLEAQLAHTPEKDDDHSDSTDSLTLGRISVWTEEWRLKMRMMSTLVQGAEDVHGGALVSLIHGYTENGDPFIRAFVSELLEEVSWGVLWIVNAKINRFLNPSSTPCTLG